MAAVSPRRHRGGRAQASTRILNAADRLPAVVLCALASHAAVYGSFEPNGAAHSYFAWYAPLVTTVSTAALVLLPVALVASLGGRPNRLGGVACRLLGARCEASGVRRRTAQIACGSLSFLVVQEALERSVVTGRLTLPHLGVSSWLVLLAAVAVTAQPCPAAAKALHTINRDLAAIRAATKLPVKNRLLGNKAINVATDRFLHDVALAPISNLQRNRLIDHAMAAIGTHCEQCFMAFEAARPIPAIKAGDSKCPKA